MGQRKTPLHQTPGHNNFNHTDMGDVWASVGECAGREKCIDPWGREIHRNEYGKKTEFGWNIDHVRPISYGGSNELENLQPLHWKTNKEKGQKPHCEKWGRC